MLNELANRGLRIPEDIALIGFGDLNFSDSTPASLTTVLPRNKKPER